jgi:hypothetical protein
MRGEALTILTGVLAFAGRGGSRYASDQPAKPEIVSWLGHCTLRVLPAAADEQLSSLILALRSSEGSRITFRVPEVSA